MSSRWSGGAQRVDSACTCDCSVSLVISTPSTRDRESTHQCSGEMHLQVFGVVRKSGEIGDPYGAAMCSSVAGPRLYLRIQYLSQGGQLQWLIWLYLMYLGRIVV